MSAKKRTKPAKGRTASSAEAGRRPAPDSPRGSDDEGAADDVEANGASDVQTRAADSDRSGRGESEDDRAGRAGATAARTSPRVAPSGGKKRKRSNTPRPPQLESVFSPIEIDFFERAADMYADEYDVWEDFRRSELN